MSILRNLINRLLHSEDEGLFRQIPLSVPGALYVSPMPFGAYDPGDDLLKIYKHHAVDHVFVLVTDDELARKSRRNLLKKYDAARITYSRFVLKDLIAPSLEVVHELTAAARTLLKSRRIAVHCHAGVGRTGIAVCCITMAVEGWSAETAIAHVSQFMTINITVDQRRCIERYEAILSRESASSEANR